MPNTTKNKTIVVIGAGASADFRKKIDGDVIAEIYRTNNQALDHPMQILKKPKGNSIAMPTGQELVNQMIGFGVEVLRFGLKSYLKNNLKLTHKISDEEFESIKNFVLKKDEDKTIWTISYDPIKDFANKGRRTGDSESYAEAESKKNEMYELLNFNFKTKFKELDKKMVEKTPLKNHLRLASLLHFYDPESIDNFLSSIEKELIDINPDKSSEPPKKDELIKAGKELIAYFLLKAEDKEIFSADNFIWYRWLREAIINGDGDSTIKIEEKIKAKIENLEIISFNYDRSLAHYLDNKMPNFSDKIKAKITYPYGSLSEAENSFEYGKLKQMQAPQMQASDDFCIFEFFEKVEFQEMAKEIFVIGEERSLEGRKDEKKLEQFKTNIIPNQTKRIYFLGFGFIKQNCDLFCATPDQTTEIYYTNFDNSQKIRRAFEYRFRAGNDYVTSHRGVYEAIQKDFEFKID